MIYMIKKIKNSLVKGKKQVWDFVFPNKIYGRKTVLAGLGDSAVTLKLQPSKNYEHIQFKGFLNWDTYEDWTEDEKKLVQTLIDEMGLEFKL